MYWSLPPDEFSVFYDRYCIYPGDDWALTIRQAVARADVVIVCLSRNAVDRRGYIQKEIRIILEEADQIPEGRAYVIPLLLDECEVPSAFQRWQWLRFSGAPLEFDFLLQTLRRVGRRLDLGGNDDDGYEALVQGFGPDILTGKKVINIAGKNAVGEDIWAYVELPNLLALRRLVAKMKSGDDVNPTDYGVILAAGPGVIPPDIKAEMAEKHNMVHLSDLGLPNITAKP